MGSLKVETPEYKLNRDFKASARLDYQHLLIKSLIGYLTHPKIPIDGKLRVADLGTGTGIWANELAAQNPSLRIDAFDVSADQFPPVAWRLPNVNFRTHDGFKPYPKEFHGQFDVVNIRFWVSIINDHTAELVLQNIVQLLKPGGYLQWFEVVPSSSKVQKADPSTPTPGFEAVVGRSFANFEIKWANDLPAYMESLGNMKVHASETYSIPPLYRVAYAHNMLLLTEEYSPWKKQDVGALQQKMLDEMEKGASGIIDHICVVGRKMA